MPATPAPEFVEQVSLTDDLAAESLPSLSDFAEEPGGPLPRAWYKAEIIEGYATRNGHQFLTSDDLSKNGDSRNLTICFKVTPNKGDPRNIQQRINYRPSDFTPERIAFVKEMRTEFKGVQGRWSDTDAQRSSLALATLGGLEKAINARFSTVGGAIVASRLVGRELDIRLTIDQNNYNEVNGHAPSGKFTPRSH